MGLPAPVMLVPGAPETSVGEPLSGPGGARVIRTSVFEVGASLVPSQGLLGAQGRGYLALTSGLLAVPIRLRIWAALGSWEEWSDPSGPQYGGVTLSKSHSLLATVKVVPASEPGWSGAHSSLAPVCPSPETRGSGPVWRNTI